jgi:hypothetical protein
MSTESFVEFLIRQVPAESRGDAVRVAQALAEFSHKLADLLRDCPAPTRETILTEAAARVRSSLARPREVPPPPAPRPDQMDLVASGKPTPEMIAWALEYTDMEEIREEIEEIRRTGGLEFRDIIHELEAAASDPPPSSAS